MNPIEHLNEAAAPVPSRYRGVWKRTLLSAPGVHDTSTTVLWMQTSRWHADIRLPSNRPDFSATANLKSCTALQRAWLASQQGFAGITAITHDAHREVCSWHRFLDFQPPGNSPDAGFMAFKESCLVETGVYADYLENWEKLPDSDNGFVALVRLNKAGKLCSPVELLLVAGEYVMHVRNRKAAWPHPLSENLTLTELVHRHDDGLLDMAISFGKRTATGWQIQHALQPWQESSVVPVDMVQVDDKQVVLTTRGQSSRWRILEWTPPSP